MNILQVNSSARPYANDTGSHSTRLANDLVAKLREAIPAAQLTVRDLGRNPHPMQDELTLQALYTPAEHRSADQAARVAASDTLVAELQAADIVVLAAPMYNFGVTTQLKAWLDAIVRAGATFRYTENGPVGLVRGKTVYVVTTRGGVHRNQATDLVTPFLQTLLGFLGMTDVRFVYAEGLALGPDAERLAMADARAQIRSLVEATELA